MPIGHSPPQARSLSPNFVLTNNVIPAQNVFPSSPVNKTDNLNSNTLTAHAALIPCSESLTPTTSNNNHTITPTNTHSTNIISFSSVNVSTTSTVTTTSTGQSTYTTFSYLKPITTTETAKSSLPQLINSTNMPYQLQTPLSKGDKQTQNNISAKRNRNSPNNTNENISKKTKNKDLPQKTLTSYWLSQPLQSNKYAALATDDDQCNNDQELQNNKNKENTNCNQNLRLFMFKM